MAFAASAQAATLTYEDTDLGSGNPVTVDDVTLTTSTDTGSIDFIVSGRFTGLWLDSNNPSGEYTFSFSELITSIEIEFDAMSGNGTPPVESLSDFRANGEDVTIGYVNGQNTLFDGTTVAAILGFDNGEGVISYSGSSFGSFSFFHNQGVQAGFVVERVTIETAEGATVVPLPASLIFLLGGIGALGAVSRRRR